MSKELDLPANPTIVLSASNLVYNLQKNVEPTAHACWAREARTFGSAVATIVFIMGD